MAVARNTTYIWSSWLAKLMAGQQACEFAPWFRSHFQQYEKHPAGDFDVAAWTMEHARLLRELRIERLDIHETVYVGNSNSFRYQPRPNVTLAGRPDLISDDFMTSPTVYAVKTGRPKTSDLVDALICMHAIPLAVQRYRGIEMRGCVVYPDNRVQIPESAVDASFISNFEYFLNVIAAETPPPKFPSEAGCRFCDIGQRDCPERWRDPSTALKLA